MQKIVQDFINYLKIERNLANNTVDAYRNDLERYSKFLLDRQISNPKSISLSDIQDFINCLTELGLAASSLARNFSSTSNSKTTPKVAKCSGFA